MNFELVQVHIKHETAEVLIRDRDGFLAFAGNIRKVSNPKAYYPPAAQESANQADGHKLPHCPKCGAEMPNKSLDMEAKLGYKDGIMSAYALLQIDDKNRDSDWEGERAEWVKKWGSAIWDDLEEKDK